VKRIARKYVDFVRRPDVGRLLATALVARMPVGMVGFAMLMFLRDGLGNFALAGTAAGIHFVSIAACAPVQGRLIDRVGPLKVLVVTSIVQPLALLAMLLAVRLHAPFAVLAVFAMLGGAFASPITTLTRTLWRHMFEREEDRRTAFALDAVTIELNFTVGPALIGALLAFASPTAAFATAIAAVVVAVAVFMSSPALRYFRLEKDIERHLLGPLTEPRLLLLYVTTFGLAMALGILEVGYPAYATALAMPALAGALLGINSLGSAIGGSLYGGLHFKARVERQFAAAMGLMVAPFFLHAVVGPFALFACVAFVAGGLIAPSIAAQSVLVSRLAPSHYATEAFTWSSTFIVSGIGAGIASGGAIVESLGVRYAFATGAAIIAAMALLALALSAPIRILKPGTQSDFAE
jgi:MFS family permease